MLAVTQQGAAQGVQVIHEQMDPHRLTQFPHRRMKTQGLDWLLVQASHRARFIVHPQVDQRDFGRFLVLAEQLQIDVGPPGRRAVPDRAAQVRLEALEALHPLQGQAPQGTQLGRLGIGAKQRDVLAHRVLHTIVVGQGRALWQAQQLQGTTLGRAVLQPLFHHQTRRGHGNFILNTHRQGLCA